MNWKKIFGDKGITIEFDVDIKEIVEFGNFCKKDSFEKGDRFILTPEKGAKIILNVTKKQ